MSSYRDALEAISRGGRTGRMLMRRYMPENIQEMGDKIVKVYEESDGYRCENIRLTRENDGLRSDMDRLTDEMMRNETVPAAPEGEDRC